MGLPKTLLPTADVDVNGTMVPIRSLSRSEALKVTQEFTDNVDGAEDYILSKGASVTLEEAHEWRENADIHTAGLVIDRIIELSGLVDSLPKEEAALTETVRAVGG